MKFPYISLLTAAFIIACSDEFGFAVLPGGIYFAENYNAFRHQGSLAIFWTSTEKFPADNGVRMYNICFDERDEIVDGNSSVNGNLFSVRCLKN